jgi:hypothetical protein
VRGLWRLYGPNRAHNPVGRNPKVELRARVDAILGTSEEPRDPVAAIPVVRSGDVPSKEAIVSDGQCRSGLAIAFLAADIAAAR